MHVVIIAASRHPVAEPFAGGLESMTWHLVRGLRSRGVQVTVFAGEGSDPVLGAELLRTRPLALSDVARSDPSMVPEVWLREHDAYLQVLIELQARADVDVVHNNSLHHLPVVLARTLPQPLVTTLHTPPTPWLEPAVDLAARSGPPRPGYVAVSRHTARMWGHVTSADVVHNGVDVDRWPLGRGGDALAWAGRIVPEKAPHLAVQMARAAGLPLRLAGPVGDARYFEDRVRPLLGADVEYVGHQTTRGLARLFGGAAATLVTPVWDEPYGLVAAESLACGTPVVAVDRGGLAEVIDERTGVLVPREDPVGAAPAAVSRALGLERSDCRRRAETSCSIDRMVEEYLRLYLRLATPVAA